jgi:hypothetical protein
MSVGRGLGFVCRLALVSAAAVRVRCVAGSATFDATLSEFGVEPDVTTELSVRPAWAGVPLDAAANDTLWGARESSAFGSASDGGDACSNATRRGSMLIAQRRCASCVVVLWAGTDGSCLASATRTHARTHRGVVHTTTHAPIRARLFFFRPANEQVFRALSLEISVDVRHSFAASASGCVGVVARFETYRALYRVEVCAQCVRVVRVAQRSVWFRDPSAQLLTPQCGSQRLRCAERRRATEFIVAQRRVQSHCGARVFDGARGAHWRRRRVVVVDDCAGRRARRGVQRQRVVRQFGSLERANERRNVSCVEREDDRQSLSADAGANAW